jgi:dTDP-4-dehydrorhamnose 3,5-epimerase-like enzyme
MNPFIVTLPEKVNDKAGKLVVIEDLDIKFIIKRLFYIYGFNTPGNVRAYHGHRNTTQVIFILNGSVDIRTHSEGQDEKLFVINRPNMYLTIPPNNLIKLDNISADAIILVLCDTYFKDDIYFT